MAHNHEDTSGMIDTSGMDAVTDAAEEVARLAARELSRQLMKKLGLDVLIRKIRRYILTALATFFGLITAFAMLYGATDYIRTAIQDAWYDYNHRQHLQLDDFYETTYEDQAAILLANMENNPDMFQNDMVILSKEDYKQILEYVVEYNKDTAFETTPERIKYWYQATEKEQVDVGGSYIYESKTVDKYSLTTCSYQSYGNETDEWGENIFALPWQTVTALCEMMSENSYREFGSDQDGWYSQNYEQFKNDLSHQTSMDGYYVTDDQITSICELVDFDYHTFKPASGNDYVEAVRNNIETGHAVYGGGNVRGSASNVENDDTYGLELSLNDMKNGTYRLVTRTVEGGTQVDYERIPAIAMNSISNCYMLVEYTYDTDVVENENVMKCTGRTIILDAKRFYDAVVQYIPDFTFTHLLELLRQLPGAENEVKKFEKLRDLYEAGQQAEEAGYSAGYVESKYQQKVVYDSTCDFYGKNLYVSRNTYDAVNFGENGFLGDSSIWIGEHDYQQFNDYLKIEETARNPLDVSDKLTKQEIQDLLMKTYLSNNAYALTKSLSDSERREVNKIHNALKGEEFAEKLYNWQETNNCSVTGTLAIALLESGRMTNALSRNKWNFTSIMGADYKAPYAHLLYGTEESQYGLIQEAFVAQMDFIRQNYWQSMRYGFKQNTFYTMQWGLYSLDVPGQDRYLEEEKKILHSYCPWWDDLSLIGSSPTGWCNLAGRMRESLLNTVGKTSYAATYLWPVAYGNKISSFFGGRVHPITQEYKLHSGIDIVHDCLPGEHNIEGSFVLATRSGTVTFAAYNGNAGNMIRIDHGDGIVSIYMHLKEIMVQTGEMVCQGQTIGTVGNTGRSTGPHLHFQIEKDHVAVDPLDYVKMPTDQIQISGQDVSVTGSRVTITASNITTSYKIGWISDLHLITDPGRETFDKIKNRYYGTEFVAPNGKRPDMLLADLITKIKQENCDFVILGGDMMDYFSMPNLRYLKSYLDELDRAGIGYLYIRSDHDLDDGTYREGASDIGQGAYTEHQNMFRDNINQAHIYDIKENGEVKILGVNSSHKDMAPDVAEEIKKLSESGAVGIVATHVPYRSKENADSLQAYSMAAKGKKYYWDSADSQYDLNGAPYHKTALSYMEKEGSGVQLIVSGHMHGQQAWSGKIKNNLYEVVFPPAFRGNVGIIEIKPKQ